ncbi:MAG: maleylpyruvate isomerase N-terminal domain-containing protein [Mycobacterium sp.]|nr:maleylpyruvate isomerase N-terminal domain-containing protein [Mycobacterium sp.]MBV9720723.1 maleylpyruvate isomerase N-terminal domain-containing protein [Mycobacterium sp.]
MAVDRNLVFSAVAGQRRQIADLIDYLDDEELATPSLCAGWDVITVAAHVLSVFADSLAAKSRLPSLPNLCSNQD